MTRLPAIAFIWLCTTAQAQQPPAPTSAQTKMMQDAAGFISGSKGYNPEKAFQLYMQCAREGNAKAMNALAVQYSKGLGVAASRQEAINWFEKAGLAGYAKAWYNLGEVYKGGSNASVDDAKAFEYYSKGAALNDAASRQSMAYMLYKGFGCQQDYARAFELYHIGAMQGGRNSMYFLGLCYRNGYGTTVNTDSARYWLARSAALGESQAKDELKLPEPENPDAIPAGVKTEMEKKKEKEAKAPKQYTKVKHQVNAEEISGFYVGYAIRYDWSGRHVISRSALSLRLSRKNDAINGTWTEDDSLTAQLQAVAADSALIFSNSRYSRIHHYSSDKPEEFEFKNTSLQMVKDKNGVYLTGNIQLFSPKRNETHKPLYITLTKIAEDKAARMMAGVAVAEEAEEKVFSKAARETALLAYPNPFTNSLNIEYTLPAAGNVRLSLLTMEGRVITHKELHNVTAGRHKEALALTVSAGAYMLVLYYGDSKESTVVIKK